MDLKQLREAIQEVQEELKALYEQKYTLESEQQLNALMTMAGLNLHEEFKLIYRGKERTFKVLGHTPVKMSNIFEVPTSKAIVSINGVVRDMSISTLQSTIVSGIDLNRKCK